jgi:hypothetical protein
MTTKTMSIKSKVVSKLAAIKNRKVKSVDPKEIKRKYEAQKKKKLADAYKFHDPCAHIKSAGNGL